MANEKLFKSIMIRANERQVKQERTTGQTVKVNQETESEKAAK
jgi:hypothetical protein